MDIAEDVVAFMKSVGVSLATVESCTGGMMAAALAAVPGSGVCLDVGLIAYLPAGKADFFGVQAETIESFGLTSEEVAREMAENALDRPGSKAGLAVSNIGVVDGDERASATGTQCFAWSWRLKGDARVTFSETARFAGSRNEVREAAAMYALSRIEHYYRLLPLEDVDDEI